MEHFKQMKRLVLLFLFFIFITPSLTHAESIRWQSYQDGLKKAKAENKKVFLNFHADW